MNTTEVLITPRSRNLAFGFNNKPEPINGYLGFSPAAAPREQGGFATLRRQLAEHRRINSGNDSRGDYFVSGKRVSDDDKHKIHDLLSMVLDPECPDYMKSVVVEVEN